MVNKSETEMTGIFFSLCNTWIRLKRLTNFIIWWIKYRGDNICGLFTKIIETYCTLSKLSEKKFEREKNMSMQDKARNERKKTKKD